MSLNKTITQCKISYISSSLSIAIIKSSAYATKLRPRDSSSFKISLIAAQNMNIESGSPWATPHEFYPFALEYRIYMKFIMYSIIFWGINSFLSVLNIIECGSESKAFSISILRRKWVLFSSITSLMDLTYAMLFSAIYLSWIALSSFICIF